MHIIIISIKNNKIKKIHRIPIRTIDDDEGRRSPGRKKDD